MSGDSRGKSHTPFAIERLSELIPEIDGDLVTVREFVNACFSGQHSDLSRLEAFNAEFCVQQLYDRMALAKGYFEQLGIGPDVEALLRHVANLRDDGNEYGVELVKLADAAKSHAAADADVLQASDGLHDRAIVLNLDLLAVAEAYETVKDLFARFKHSFGFADGIGQTGGAIGAALLNPEISKIIAERAAYAVGEQSADAAVAPKKAKRSTERGEGRAKLIAALTKHHDYGDGGCLNQEPIGNNELARLADVTKRTASAFFMKEFHGHAKYKVLCNDLPRLAAALKALNGEFCPHDFYGARTPDDLDQEDD